MNADTLTITDDLDIYSVSAWKSRLTLLMLRAEADAVITIDFTRCQYVDSAGLNLLISAWRHRPTTRVRVKAGTGPSRLMQITKLNTIMAVEVVPIEPG